MSILMATMLLAGIMTARAQGTAFTYQGQLQNNGTPAHGTYNFSFSLFGMGTGGTAAAGPVNASGVNVTNGMFSVQIDFGAAPLAAASCWLQISVETNGGTAFMVLTPRQPLTATPYAVIATTAQSSASAAANSVASGAIQNGAVSGASIAGGQVIKSVSSGATTIYDNITLSAGNNVTITPSGQTLTIAASTGGGGSGWSLTGNAGTTPGPNFTGTTDNQPWEAHVNSTRAFRLEPNSSGAPNIVGGSPVNSVASGTVGSTIGGGGATNYSGAQYSNTVAGSFATISGGANNTINPYADDGVIGGGFNNTIQTYSGSSVIAGGFGNSIAGADSSIGGGFDNYVATDAFGGAAVSSIAGGSHNTNIANYATIGGGEHNYNSYGDDSVIGGGSGNSIEGTGNLPGNSAYRSVIAGGYTNAIQTGAYESVIGGGSYNAILANANDATISGGNHNTVGNLESTVAGGAVNTASGIDATVGGGRGNQATNYYATVPGGQNNLAGGQYSFAAGYNAQALHTGAFVWNDGNGVFTPSTNNNSVTMRASGGFRLMSSSTSPTTGVFLPPGGGSWVSLSDRNSKENFRPVDSAGVLQKVAELPITTWNYKTEAAAIRHIGPVAQDFKSSFGLGETETGIATVDEGGVALAAIQGLNEKLKREAASREAEVETLHRQNESMSAQLVQLQKLVDAVVAQRKTEKN